MKAFLFGMLGGIVIGAMLAMIAGRVIDSRRDPWPDAVMAVLGHELKTLRGEDKEGRCATPASQAALQRMHLMAQDIEPALLAPGSDDRVFRQYATDLRNALAQVTTAGADCKLATAAVSAVGQACQACHRDYR